MQTEINEKNCIEESVMDKKQKKILGLTYLFVALIYFIAIILSNLSQLFEPIYMVVGYKKYNSLFFYLIGSILLLIFYLIIRLVIVRKLKIEYPKEHKQLSIIKVVVIYSLTVLTVFVISAICGFELKFIHDLGEKFTMNSAYQQMVKLLYRGIALFYAVQLIENLQYGLENLIPIKNDKVRKHLPLGGIATMLIFGLYEYFTGLSGSLFVLYILLYTVYGYLYLYTDRNKFITYLVMIILMLL